MIAVALSPKARALIQAHREAGRPTAADRQRVTAALRARLGSAVLPLERPIRDRWMSNIAQHRSAAALGAVCRRVGVVARSTARDGVEPRAGDPAQVSRGRAFFHCHGCAERAFGSERACGSERSTGTTSTGDGCGGPSPPSTEAPRAPAQDTLAQEVLLLSSATSQLSSGQAAVALQTFERASATVFARCPERGTQCSQGSSSLHAPSAERGPSHPRSC